MQLKNILTFLILVLTFNSPLYADEGNPTFHELKTSLLSHLENHNKDFEFHSNHILRLAKAKDKHSDPSYAICGHLAVLKNELEQMNNGHKKILWDLTRLDVMVGVAEHNQNKELNELIGAEHIFDFPFLDLQVNKRMPLASLQAAQIALEKIIIEYDTVSTISCRRDMIKKLTNTELRHKFYKEVFDEIGFLTNNYKNKVQKLPNSKTQRVFVPRPIKLQDI